MANDECDFRERNLNLLKKFCKQFTRIKVLYTGSERDKIDSIFEGINLIISSQENSWDEENATRMMNDAICIFNKISPESIKNPKCYSIYMVDSLICRFCKLYNGMNIKSGNEFEKYLKLIFDGIDCIGKSGEDISSGELYEKTAKSKQISAEIILSNLEFQINGLNRDIKYLGNN